MLSRTKKHTAIIMISLMVITLFFPGLMQVEKAYALTEKIESYSEITTGSSNTFQFKVGGKVGICMQAKGVPSGIGQTCTMTAYANTNPLAKLAYLAKTTFGFNTNKKKYIVSRAASYIAGYTAYNNYLYYKEVNSLVAKTRGALSVPDTFIAYHANPTNGGQEILCWDTRANGYIKVTKGRNLATGINSGYPVLTGAKYTATSSTGKTVKTMTITSSGVSNTITVPVGTYKVKETTAPAGYKVDQTTYTITVTKGATDNVSSKDTPKAGKAKLQIKSTMPEISHGNSNYSLAGADFAVYNSKDVKAGTFTTTASGASNTLALLAGTYTLKQTGAAKGYKIRTEALSFSVTDGATKEAPIDQVPITATLKLIKKSAMPSATDNNPEYSLSGAKYQVVKKGSTARVGILTTTVSGVSNTLTLPLNTYTVKEITAPKGFKVDSSSYEVDFTTVKTTMALNVTDEPKDYLVRYKGNGGRGVMEDQRFLFEEKKILSANQYVADTKFTHWTLMPDGSGKRFADKAVFNGVSYVENGVVTLYAQWNTLPDITAPITTDKDGNKVTPFIKSIKDRETLVIQKKDKFVAPHYQRAMDREDGDLTDKVVIKKNIPLRDERATEAGLFDVVYEVTDSMGETTTKTITVLVNDPPKGNAPERYFYLDSKTSEEILFEQLSITDKEDGKILYSKGAVELLSINGKKGVAFDTSKEGKFAIQYKIRDSLKGETEGSFFATVVEDRHSFTDRISYFPRYIDLASIKYLDTNSIWITDPGYNKTLMESLTRKAPLYTYKIKG